MPFEQVWGLLVDGTLEPGLPPAEPHPLAVRSGDPRVDVQAALAMLAPEWGFGQLIDVSDEQARNDLARASVMALSFVAQSARGAGRPPVPQREVDRASSIPERFLIRWRGEADPEHVEAIDAYWISAAEHGMNASTFTARVVASTGADVAAALSARRGRAVAARCTAARPRACSRCSTRSSARGDAAAWVKAALDRGERLMGFGHRVYRAEDPRARVLRRTAREIGSPRYEVAEALEEAALAELQARKPDRVLATNVEFWSAVVLDLAEVPPELFTPLFTCARTAGWSAHILEQKREGRLIRPTARYVGRAIALPGGARCLECASLPVPERGPNPNGVCDRRALHRHQGQLLRRGLPGRLHPPDARRTRLRGAGDALHRPGGVHRLRCVRRGLPGRRHASPRTSSPRNGRASPSATPTTTRRSS